MSGLTALYIERRFGNDFVDVSDVTMETVTVASGNDVEVSDVENCTCNSGSNTGGMTSLLTSSTSYAAFYWARELVVRERIHEISTSPIEHRVTHVFI